MVNIVDAALASANVPAPAGATVQPSKSYPLLVPALIETTSPAVRWLAPIAVPPVPVPTIVSVNVSADIGSNAALTVISLSAAGLGNVAPVAVNVIFGTPVTAIELATIR